MYFKAAQISVITDHSFIEQLKLGGTAGLNDALQRKPFQHCTKLQAESFGFVEPIATANDALAVQVGSQFILFKARHEVKHLPPKAINQILMERLDAIEAAEGRRPGKKEREQLKEDITVSLLPNALPVSETIYGWFDLVRGWLVICTQVAKKADTIGAELREVIGSMPTVPAFKSMVTASDNFTCWYQGGKPEVLDKVGFAMPIKMALPADTISSSTHRSLDLDDSAIQAGLENGMKIIQFGLRFDERFYAQLDEKAILKSIKFDDKLLESDGGDGDLISDFLISINAITELYEILFEALTLTSKGQNHV